MDLQPEEMTARPSQRTELPKSLGSSAHDRLVLAWLQYHSTEQGYYIHCDPNLAILDQGLRSCGLLVRERWKERNSQLAPSFPRIIGKTRSCLLKSRHSTKGRKFLLRPLTKLFEQKQLIKVSLSDSNLTANSNFFFAFWRSASLK